MSNFNSNTNDRRSISSVPPTIRQSSSHQVAEANSSLSSGISALSREKRTRDQMNDHDRTQPTNNANAGNNKIKKKSRCVSFRQNLFHCFYKMINIGQRNRSVTLIFWINENKTD